jgi:DMSO/TMAO reductase YedYZ molybdopterin-dependent catalytic subunit
VLTVRARRLARGEMLTRRALLGAAGCSVVAPALAAAQAEAAPPLASLPGKKPLIQRAFRPPNFETPPAGLVPAYTPNDLFFVRYHLAVIPWVDAAAWRLSLVGPSVRKPFTLSLGQLQREFPVTEIAAVNQCSGNRRGLFSPRVPGVQWGNGAMGNALWRGVRLRDVLRRAELAPDALEVVVSGADGPVLPKTPAFVKSLPMDRALDDSTLIAFAMNGEPLPHWNGAPARLVVPGWTGTYWMKHLTDIRVQPKPYDGFWMKSGYRLPTGAFPGYRFASQETPENTPITEILVNSLITSHAAVARLRRGSHEELAGKAWDGGAGIEAVEISTDGRRTWRAAKLAASLGRYAWREFHFALDTAAPGTLEVAVRARSRNGARQPDQLTPNPSGYHDNIVQTVTLEVA